MQDLRVSLIQYNPEWHKINENLQHITALIKPLQNATDIIVLPEMFTTGFTNSSNTMAEKMYGGTYQWMQNQAQNLNSVVCGSIIIDVDGKYYNRFLWVDPDGKTTYYDKRHLFRMAKENNFYSAGINQINISYKGWKIRPLICYDLRFPVWARNTVKKDQFDYDLLVFVANWPKARVDVWDTLLKARAMENYAYSLGVNRVGKDENDIVYNGHSAIYGPKGEEYCMLEDSEEVMTITLEKRVLDDFRKKVPIYMDADRFELKMD